MLTVLEAANSHDLTTLATVKAELGITGTVEDAKLATFIRQASGIVAEHCCRVFGAESVAETFDLCRSQGELVLSRYPVSSILGVTEAGEALEPDEYEIHSSAGIFYRMNGSARTFWPAVRVVVSYSAGYALLSDLPYGIERATIEMVKEFRVGATRDPRIRTEDIEGVLSVSYFGRSAGLSPEIAGLLAPHRNRRVV